MWFTWKIPYSNFQCRHSAEVRTNIEKEEEEEVPEKPHRNIPASHYMYIISTTTTKLLSYFSFFLNSHSIMYFTLYSTVSTLWPSNCEESLWLARLQAGRGTGCCLSPRGAHSTQKDLQHGVRHTGKIIITCVLPFIWGKQASFLIVKLKEYILVIERTASRCVFQTCVSPNLFLLCL